MPLTTLVAGNTVTASGLNNNFSACLLKDTSGTVTVTHTYTASQTFTGGFTSASTGTLTGLTYTLDVKSVSAFATPSALSATQFTGFASTVSGAALMGFGTTNDVSLMNRAGTVCLGVGPNTTAVNIPGSLVLTGATVTGLTAASVGAGTFPAGAFVFAGAVSGITTLAGSGAVSGFTTATVSSNIVSSGGYILSGTTSTNSMGAGDIMMPNAHYLRGLTVGGVGRAMIGRDGADKVSIDPDALGTLFGGAVSGITTLAGSGAVSGFTSATFSGTAYVGDTANANVTLGLTINQGAADDHILALKSSDVAHGETTWAETDTFCYFKKVGATTGGTLVHSFSTATIGFGLQADAVTQNTTKATTSIGAISLTGAKKDGGTGFGDMDANANIVCIINNGTTRFIFDTDAEAHADASWTTF